MAKRRYTDGYMIYGCSECGRGFKMYLEENLEKPSQPGCKPVPFTIECPFCKTHNLRDVGFKRFNIPRRRIDGWMPTFVNDAGDPCGRPIHMDRAHVEYRHRSCIPRVELCGGSVIINTV